MLGFNAGINSGLTVLKLVITETGTYNDQFYRPYTATVDPTDMNELANRLDRFQHNEITPGAVAGIANRMFVPSADVQGRIDIPNGWNQRRLSFMLELVETANPMGTAVHYIFQGYTDYPGVTLSGAIDPQMRFIINSCISFRDAQSWTPSGVMILPQVMNNSQIMSNPWASTPLQGKPLYMERPTDVFLGIQMNNIAAEMGRDNTIVGLNTSAQLLNSAQGSKRKNNVPTEFLTKVLSSYRDANLDNSYLSNSHDVYGRAREFCNDGDVYTNPFIRYLGDQYSHTTPKDFRFPDLVNLDPTTDSKTIISTIGNAAPGAIQLHQTGATEYLHGSDIETMWANQIVHAVASLMSECLITKIKFSSQNMYANPFGMAEVPPRTVIHEGKSFSTVNLQPYYQIFLNHFDRGIMSDLTANDVIQYELHVTVDLFGESRVEIKIGNGPMTPFVIPTFCDNLISPVISPNVDTYNQFVHGVDQVLASVSDAIGTPVISKEIQRI
jgi:hypothetical protein